MHRRDPQNDVSTTAIPEVSLVFDGTAIIEITIYSTSTITTDASTTTSDVVPSTTSASSTGTTTTSSTPSPSSTLATSTTSSTTSSPSSTSSTLATSTTLSTTSSTSSTSPTDLIVLSATAPTTSTISGQATTTSPTSTSTANATSVPFSGNGVSGTRRFTDADATAVAGSVVAAAVIALLLALCIALCRNRRQRKLYRQSIPQTKLVPTASEVDSWRRPSGNMIEAAKPPNSRTDRHLRISNLDSDVEGVGALATTGLLGAGAGAARAKTPPSRPQHPDVETRLLGDSSLIDHSLYNQSTSRVVFAGLPRESESSGEFENDVRRKHDSGVAPDVPAKSIYRLSTASSSNDYLRRLGPYIDGDLPRAASVTPPSAPEERPLMHATLDSPADSIGPYYDEDEPDEFKPIMQPPALHTRNSPAAPHGSVHYPNLSEFMEFDFAYGQSTRNSHASSQQGHDQSWYRDSRASS